MRQENRHLARVQKGANHQKHFRVCFSPSCLLINDTNILPGSSSPMIASIASHQRELHLPGSHFSVSFATKYPPTSSRHRHHRRSTACTLIKPSPQDCSTFGNSWTIRSLTINRKLGYSFRVGSFSQMSF
jgi:hypothetical protein